VASRSAPALTAPVEAPDAGQGEGESDRAEAPGAAAYVPDRPTLETLRDAAQQCRGCELYRDATQAVVGEGALDAAVMLVGEQPGDKEDLAGKPFVGPAGQLLVKGLDAAGMPREAVFRCLVSDLEVAVGALS
jgi:uracil-DNA glycosylase